MFEKIKKWYKQGLWNASMVQQAAEKGFISRQQADQITGVV